MNIELKRASKDDQPVIENICQFYIYEFGPIFEGIELQPDGRYRGISDMDLYWSEPDRHPFLVHADGKLAGFVLITEGKEGRRNNVDQFFILRQYMGRGIGSRVAHQIFDLFPGRWCVTQVQKNYAAQAFWRHVIGKYTQDQFTEYYDDTRRSVQEFDNSH